MAGDSEARKQRERIEHVELCYNRFFESDDGKEILKDLRAVCCVDKSTAPALDHPNIDAVTQRNEGRREVFLHIISRVKMSITEFYLQRDKKKVESKL